MKYKNERSEIINKLELINDIEKIVEDNLQYFEKAVNNLEFNNETVRYSICILLSQAKYNILKYILDHIYNDYE